MLATASHEPDYRSLLDRVLLRDGSEVEAARFIVPRFEVEFAFVLARPLGVGHAPTDTPEVRRVALGFDERVPERFKDNLRDAKERA